MASTKQWNTTNIPDIAGKTVLITGANSGIGYEAARALAQRGAEVMMACRSREKGEAAVQAILEETPQAKLNLMALNLADLASVREFAEKVRTEYAQLDLLINNAGVMAIPYRQTAEGFEMQLGTNHLGHFALTGLLLDLVLKAENARIVTISSQAHKTGRINFDDLNSEKSYSKWLAYGQSKLANLLFAYELQRKLAAAGHDTLSVAAHPGYSATNLQDSSGIFSALNPLIAQSAAMGALPTLFAATHPEVEGGDFIGPRSFGGWRGYPAKARSNLASYDESVAKKLWAVSEELTGVQYSF
ncbi:MAG: SDR family oxidoreductase [Chloroflexi bacterium]|jgi:NAD(P)-dependent dehydrogenase (short-subunit alcohol dehydrogenase family)|nr:SDR family oxidoreductase [Chloroflexota bacterium]